MTDDTPDDRVDDNPPLREDAKLGSWHDSFLGRVAQNRARIAEQMEVARKVMRRDAALLESLPDDAAEEAEYQRQMKLGREVIDRRAELFKRLADT